MSGEDWAFWRRHAGRGAFAVDIPEPYLIAARALASDELWPGRPGRRHSLNSDFRTYAEVVRVISHPAAVFRGQFVRGMPRLRSMLVPLILLNRARWLLYGGAIGAAVVLSWWLLLAMPVVFLLNFAAGISRFWVNYAIYTRILALDMLNAEHPEMLQSILATMEPLADQATP